MVAVMPKKLPFFKVGKELKERISGAAKGVKPGAATARRSEAASGVTPTEAAPNRPVASESQVSIGAP
jgi:hypothetical protein